MNKNRIAILYMLFLLLISGVSRGASGVGLEPRLPIYPFFRVVEGYSLPYVEDVRQRPSPFWDIGAGLSYEYLSLGISFRSHFLASNADSLIDNNIELATEGHTAMMVAHIEGKADVRPVRFAASIDLGMIWFHEYDLIRHNWTRSKLPVIGLGLDFRIPVSGSFALCFGGEYMAAFEGFQVDAKAYNSIQAVAGIVYDGAIIQ